MCYLSHRNWPTGEVVGKPLPVNGSLGCISYNPTGKQLAAVLNSSVVLLEASSGRTISQSNSKDAKKVVWSPDGRYLGVVLKGRIALCDAKSLKEIITVPIEYACSVTFSPDAKFVVFGSWSKGQVWEVATLLKTNTSK